jgi:hypothetical protein
VRIFPGRGVGAPVGPLARWRAGGQLPAIPGESTGFSANAGYRDISGALHADSELRHAAANVFCDLKKNYLLL